MDNQTYDMVNHPEHYSKGQIECIDAMQDIFTEEIVMYHCAVTAFKYIWRYQNKANPKQDIEKAVWYLTKAVDISHKLNETNHGIGNAVMDSTCKVDETYVTYLESAYNMTAEMYIAIALNTYCEYAYDDPKVPTPENLSWLCKKVISYLNAALKLMD